MKQYHDFLKLILDKGVHKSDRTGTGTTSIFGHQMRFDLREGFPLITTKKVHWVGAVHELLWFISGSTKTKDLDESVQKWWSPWTPESGDLGPIYGQQMRASRWWEPVEPLIFDPPEPPNWSGTVFGVGELGSHRLPTGSSSPGEPANISMLKATWREMLRRCYHRSSANYASYGAVGVHVDERWHSFENFAEDAVRLPGWYLKLDHPDLYSLDKDIRRASNRYSKDTCMWASRAEQGWNLSTSMPFMATSPDGEEVLFPSIGEMHRLHGANMSAVHRCLNGKLNKHHGWTNFRYVEHTDGKIMRFRELDQIRQLIASIRHEPDSRRHLMNLWHTPAMQHAALPCCHGSVIQCHVANGRLSLHVYQRSADVFIGVPVNFASYALLCHMLAQQCDLEVADLVWTGGDCHIYDNHREQVAEQLSRDEFPLPTLRMGRKPPTIDDYHLGDFIVENYQHHPAIKAPIAV